MGNIEYYLSQLNKQQKEAVLENSRPLLVLAGAGSGKTRVITTKIAYAIEVLNLQPYEILAVTFTNRAAKEMKDRVEQMVKGVDLSEMHIRTFHSFGAWLLRRYGSSVNLKSGFTIYDDDDSLSVLASCFPTERKNDLIPVSKAISLAKDRNLTYKDPKLKEFRHDENFVSQFEKYEQKLRKIGNVDFADLIVRSLELLKKDKSVAEKIRNRFKMILVDEYQDSNISQFKLLKALVGKNTFICVVGDDDQSIYRFRGAEVENILSFPDVYPNTRTIKLEQNYRSTKRIINLASSIIANNTSRHPKTLFTEAEEGSAIRLLALKDEREEALRIATEIKGRNIVNNSAILYRTNAQSVAFEKLFISLKIPYKIIGALRFYEREEIKDGLALLALLLNRNDEISFKRVVNKPTRSLGAVAIANVLEIAESKNIDLIAALKLYGEKKNSLGAREFVAVIESAETEIYKGNGPMLNLMLHKSKLYGHYLKYDSKNETDKVDNLENLISAVDEYPSTLEGLTEFMESLTLDPTTLGYSDPSDKEGITLITMHNTKGLEFDNVYVTGLEEGLFPSRSSESRSDIEEERRIFYVAVTRAKKELTLTYCTRRLIWGRINYFYPSRFLKELDRSLIEEKRELPVTDSTYENITRNYSPTVILKPVTSFKQRPKVEDRSFVVGERVYHNRYGEGKIQNIKALKNTEMVDVKFSDGSCISFFSDTPLLEKVEE